MAKLSVVVLILLLPQGILFGQSREILFKSKERHYCPYQEGKIVIHNGFNLHQIAILDDYQKDDVRITLQGHAIRFDKVWKVYW